MVPIRSHNSQHHPPIILWGITMGYQVQTATCITTPCLQLYKQVFVPTFIRGSVWDISTLWIHVDDETVSSVTYKTVYKINCINNFDYLRAYLLQLSRERSPSAVGYAPEHETQLTRFRECPWHSALCPSHSHSDYPGHHRVFRFGTYLTWMSTGQCTNSWSWTQNGHKNSQEEGCYCHLQNKHVMKYKQLYT